MAKARTKRGRKPGSTQSRQKKRNALMDAIRENVSNDALDKIGYIAYRNKASRTDLGFALHTVLTETLPE